MQVRKLFMMGALMLLLVPGTALAQSWFFTPFIGANFGGNANFGDFQDFDDEVERRVDFGATLGWIGRAVWASKWTSATRRTSSRTPLAAPTSSSATAT